MLKLLIRLWWLHKSRTFTKRELIVGLYFFMLYVVVLVGFYLGFSMYDGSVEDNIDTPSVVGLIIAAFLLVPDIIMKMSMKGDAVFMDDYLKSRPVPERIWGVFLLFSNVTNFLNYLLPIIMLPFLFFLFGWKLAVADFALMLFLSYADSLFVTCFRRTSDNFLRFSLIAGWFIMLAAMSLILLFSVLLPVWMQYIGMFVLAFAVLSGLVVFLANEENYDESRHKAVRHRSLGKVTLFTMQLYGLIRAKRLRVMVMLMFLIFIFDAYIDVWISPEDASLVLYTVLAVIMPSLVLSQWTFGVEANFFSGLITKPVTVEEMLDNCYYFYILLSFVGALFMIPVLFFTSKFTLLMLIASFSIALFINLFNMPTCLFSTRLELFSNSFFNMQGANMKINFYSLALLLPAAIFVGIYLLCGPVIWSIVSIVTGVISIAVHRKVIKLVAMRFVARRYSRLETFSKQ